MQAERAVGWGMIQQAAAQSQCCCMVAPACPGAHLVGQQPLVSQALHCSRALRPDLHVIALDGAPAVIFRALFESKPQAQMAQPWHRQAVLARHAAARPVLRTQTGHPGVQEVLGPFLLACRPAALASQRMDSEVWLEPMRAGVPQGPGGTAAVRPSPSGLHRLRPASFSARTRNLQGMAWAQQATMQIARRSPMQAGCLGTTATSC